MAIPRQMVFVSHISEEAELAARLQEQIETDFLGLASVFVSSDTTSIRRGTEWLPSLKEALGTATVMVILASPAAVRRPWINFEVGAAWVRGIAVVPACHGGMRPRDLPMPLAALQSVDLTTKEGWISLYGLIAQILELAPPRVDFAGLVDKVRRFQSASPTQATSQIPAGAGESAGIRPEQRRLSGTWTGSAQDIEITGLLEYESKLTYEVRLTLEPDGTLVSGKLQIDNPERQFEGSAIVEVTHYSEAFFSFRYRLADLDSTHFGVTLCCLLPSNEIRGFYLSKKIFEMHIGFGQLRLQKQPQ